MENFELQHSGIKGMRWGIRRYQNKDGTLTPEGKKRYGKGEDDDDRKETYEEAKARAIKSGSASEVLKYRGDLTQQEMQYISNRIRWEQEMQGISSKDVDAGKSTADKVFGAMDKATGYANTAIKTWNTVANVANALTDSTLPKIDTNITSGNKQERKAAKDEANKKGKRTDLDELGKNIDKLSDDDLDSYVKRASKEKMAKNYADERTKAKSAKEEKTEPKTEEKSEPKSEAKSESKKDKVYEGTVVGEGTSKGNASKSKDTGPVIDVDFTEVTVSNVPATVRNTGKAYVDKLLERN